MDAYMFGDNEDEGDSMPPSTVVEKFWGVQVGPNKKYTQNLPFNLRLKQVSLGYGAVRGERYLVYMLFDGVKYLLCSLRLEKCEQVRLNLLVEATTKISFSLSIDKGRKDSDATPAKMSEGERVSVSICGNFEEQQLIDMGDSDDDDSDDAFGYPDDDESDDDDSDDSDEEDKEDEVANSRHPRVEEVESSDEEEEEEAPRKRRKSSSDALVGIERERGQHDSDDDDESDEEYTGGPGGEEDDEDDDDEENDEDDEDDDEEEGSDEDSFIRRRVQAVNEKNATPSKKEMKRQEQQQLLRKQDQQTKLEEKQQKREEEANRQKKAEEEKRRKQEQVLKKRKRDEAEATKEHERKQAELREKRRKLEQAKELKAAKDAASSVIQKSNGLTINIKKSGHGQESVRNGQKLTVNYVGRLHYKKSGKAGKKFDANNGFGFTCGGGVIEGWSQGLVGAKVGETRHLIIPPALGYGRQGAPPDIPPNSWLEFDVTVTGVGGARTPSAREKRGRKGKRRQSAPAW
eukprot:TRINITY_DN2252_c1_g1_i1.p1 TRINITY_DN2252_c1_g1~~TRINITY_DN2252_c1_g1_i1.p1  ORF type:complete len:517 (-),score=224.11 TRINITY_DN2252_c1_g1_i1:87-1637(-)